MDEANQLEAFLERVRSLLGPNPPAVGAGEVEAILELAAEWARSTVPSQARSPRLPAGPGVGLAGQRLPGAGRP
jgi:hypothetical protein